jgi:hypothetical protein
LVKNCADYFLEIRRYACIFKEIGFLSFPYLGFIIGGYAMYEHMLNKHEIPTFDDLILYSGASGILWLELDKYLETDFKLSKLVRFPYGSSYGWGVKYSKKSKLICDAFAENGAFTVMIRLSDTSMDMVYNDLGEYAKSLWDDKYPCNGGGWIHFRVVDNEGLIDLESIIQAKMRVK